MKPCETEVALAPGELKLQENDLVVGAANATTLALDEVQLEGKPRMDGVRFARDYQLQPGELLD
jgi:methionyl-tRNA formyltransferase